MDIYLYLCFITHKSGDNTINTANYIMNNEVKNFIATERKSKATILNQRMVEVIAPDGETFSIISKVGIYDSEDTRNYMLRTMEAIFDKNYTDDKELMRNNIWRDFTLNAVPFLGISSGDRQSERVRIGKKIREIREEKGIEARDLAKSANIDAANLSRIEQGKYSVGIDILSKLAFVMGYHIDIVQNPM